ncbi:MAG: hypothetical protein ACI8RZ_001408 [Myxococcota bacterium]|jgi:hypothetical protein
MTRFLLLTLLPACGNSRAGFSSFSSRIHEDIGSLVTVAWSQSDDDLVVVEYSFDEGEWLTTPAMSVGEDESAEALLLGVPYGMAVTWRLVGEVLGTSEEQLATTDALPDDLPEATLVLSDPLGYHTESGYLLGSINADDVGWSGGDYWKFILDRKGRYVWAMETPNEHWSIFLRQSRDGTAILWDEATYWSSFSGEGEDGQVHRMKIDGTIEDSIPTPGLHHAFVELEDGRLAWGDASAGMYEDLVEYDTTGDIVTVWSCEDFLSALGIPEGLSYEDKWTYEYCESNTLYWHEPTDTFLYSFYSSSSVLEIDHSGEVLWHAGQLHSGYEFSSEDDVFSWQHGVHYTDAGTLLLSSEANCGDPDVCPYGNETVVFEYDIDHDNARLETTWTFGRGGGLYGNTAGEAHRLDNGNTLHNYGTGSAVKEATVEGEVVWWVEWEYFHLLGRTTFIEDLYAFAP